MQTMKIAVHDKGLRWQSGLSGKKGGGRGLEWPWLPQVPEDTRLRIGYLESR